MSEIKVIKVYNLVNANGTKLQLRLGLMKNMTSDGFAVNGDEGMRWSFIGREIPMPVRSSYWFNGFPEEVMMNWLMDHGWALQTKVDMESGKAIIFNKMPEAPKGNKNPSLPDKQWEYSFKRIIRKMVANGNKADAIMVYRYAHGGNLRNANDAINIIVTE